MSFLTYLLSRRITSYYKTIQRTVSYKHRVNYLDKKFLVWTGRYRYVREVPQFVDASIVEKARSKIRIYLVNLMMFLTLIASYFMIRSGRAAHEEGDSLQKRNLEWHKKLKEEQKKYK